MKETVLDDGWIQYLGNWRGVRISMRSLKTKCNGYYAGRFLDLFEETTGVVVHYAQDFARDQIFVFVEPFHPSTDRMAQALHAAAKGELEQWIKENS